MISIIVTAVIAGGAGVIVGLVYSLGQMDSLRAKVGYWKMLAETDERIIPDLRDSNMRLADQVCALHHRIQRIRDIPNNGKKPNGGLLKAQRIAGGEG